MESFFAFKWDLYYACGGSVFFRRTTLILFVGFAYLFPSWSPLVARQYNWSQSTIDIIGAVFFFVFYHLNCFLGWQSYGLHGFIRRHSC